MQLSVLGPVLVDGQPPPGAKERALLARLAVTPGLPVPADTLIDAAWPASRPDGVARSLHVRLARLRGVLEPGRPAGSPGTVLVREPAGYRLTVARESVDAHRLARLADEAAHSAPGEALAACDEALALWRGEPFADIDTADETTAVEARRLCGIRDRLRHLRALALRDLGRTQEAVGALEDLAADEPLREDLVRDLMLVRYDAGRHPEALEAYRALARRLADVGLQPGPELRELERLMLHHADELTRRTAAPSPTPPTNVGVRIASVVGREAEVAATCRLLAEHRIVTLVGPGGVGKTTLARELARAALDRLPDGAWLVELAPVGAAGEVLPAVGTALGLRRVGTGDGDGDLDALGILAERLRDARLLLVLDRAEHLVPDVAEVARSLAAAGPGVHVLVTSRRPLGIPGEAVVPVAPLPEAAAEELFVERARAARPGWTPDPGEDAAVARICRRLDGLPLALELAAARLRALSAGSIAERLEAGLAVLGRGALDASIDASHALLTHDEQELFRRLSVFAGPFRLEDAERVGGGDGLDPDAVLDLLVALTDHSLVQAEGDSPRRYRMLEALRDYGRARLDPAAAEAAARRHATHFAHLGASLAGRVGHAGAEAVGEPLVPYQWDLHAASDWAAAHGEADLALELATALGAFHHLVGTVTPGRELIDRALALPGGDPARRIGAMRWQIGLLLCELRLPAAAEAIGAAGEVIRRHGTPGDLDQLRGFEAQLALCLGDFEAAERAGEDLYPRLLRRGERYFAAYAMWTRGHVALVRGDPDAAARHFAPAYEHMVEVHDICALDNVSAAMADALRAAGREDEAADVCARTLAIAADRPLGERNTYLLHEAALAAAGAGAMPRAAELAGSAMTGARRDPVSIGPWHAPTARGDVALAAGDRTGARREHEVALALALQVREEVGPSLPVEARIALSHLRLADLADTPSDAGRHVLLALEHARASGAPAILTAVEGAAAAHAETRQAAAGGREPVTVP